jgi:hypothetical protein
MRMFNHLATFNEQMNRKNSSLSVKEIWEFQAQLLSVIKYVPFVFQDYSMVTGKVHVISHLVGEILKFGMNPNHSSTIFESSFNKDKQMAKESKNNLMPAIRNNTGLQSSF